MFICEALNTCFNQLSNPISFCSKSSHGFEMNFFGCRERDVFVSLWTLPPYALWRLPASQPGRLHKSPSMMLSGCQPQRQLYTELGVWGVAVPKKTNMNSLFLQNHFHLNLWVSLLPHSETTRIFSQKPDRQTKETPGRLVLPSVNWGWTWPTYILFP